MTRQLLFIIGFFVLLTFSSTVAFANEPILNIHELESKSGVKIWLVKDHSIPVVSLQFAFKNRGAVFDPPEKQGLSRLASNTMDEGAGDIQSQVFQKELNDLSISLYFSSGRDTFGGTLKTLTKNKERAFELLRLAVNNPRFDTAPVDRMRQSNQARIRSSLSNPEWIAARISNDRSFEGHPYAQNSGGTLSTLTDITVDDLKDFHKKLTRDVLVVAISGDMKGEEAINVVDKIFGQLPSASNQSEILNTDIRNQGEVFLYEQKIPQTVLDISYPGIGRDDPDYYTAIVLNHIFGGGGFGSRLMEEIREKRGLTYGIYTGLVDMNYVDYMSISTSTENGNVPEVLSLIAKTMETLKTVKVDEKELADTKSYLIGSMPLSLTSTDAISGLMLSLMQDDLPKDYLDDRVSKISEVSSESIQKLAERLLKPETMSIVLVGNPSIDELKALKDSKNFVKNITKIEDLPNVE